MPIKFSSIMISTEGEKPTEYDLEVTIMALSNLFGWSKKQRLPLLLRRAVLATSPLRSLLLAALRAVPATSLPKSLPLVALPAVLATSRKI